MRKAKATNLLDVKETIQSICANGSAVTCAILNRASSINAYNDEESGKTEIGLTFDDESGLPLSTLQEVISESFTKATLKAIETLIKETGYKHKESITIASAPSQPASVNRHEIL